MYKSSLGREREGERGGGPKPKLHNQNSINKLASRSFKVDEPFQLLILFSCTQRKLTPSFPLVCSALALLCVFTAFKIEILSLIFYLITCFCQDLEYSIILNYEHN